MKSISRRGKRAAGVAAFGVAALALSGCGSLSESSSSSSGGGGPCDGVEAGSVDSKALDGATNAGLLAAQILALEDEELAARLETLRARQTASVPEAPQDDA